MKPSKYKVNTSTEWEGKITTLKTYIDDNYKKLNEKQETQQKKLERQIEIIRHDVKKIRTEMQQHSEGTKKMVKKEIKHCLN